ncbi:MAG TPA: hypothetical protein VMF13_17575, partial [Luteitalea sp.]|nr:hypothetical protein [Luteitalea sp.]
RWPGKVPAGKVDGRSILTAQDVFPTLCAIAGATLPGGEPLDGIDVSRAWRGQPITRRAPLLWEYGRNDEFFQYGPDRSPSLAVRRGDWKLLINPDRTRTELYDIVKDPAEQQNVAGAHPAVVAELTALLFDWRETWPRVSP